MLKLENTPLQGYKLEVGHSPEADNDIWIEGGLFWLLNIFDKVASLELCSVLCMTTPSFYFDTKGVQHELNPNAWVFKAPLKQCACLFYYEHVCTNYFGRKAFDWVVKKHSNQRGILYSVTKNMNYNPKDTHIVLNMDQINLNILVECYGKQFKLTRTYSDVYLYKMFQEN